MSHHEKGKEQDPTQKVIHNPIPTSLYLFETGFYSTEKWKPWR